MGNATERTAELNCYLIPGVGATREIFSQLSLPESWSRQYIQWLPNRKNESLPSYCKRLLPQIDQTKPFILVGVSFGGAVAVELAKLCEPVLVVLISSIPVRKGFPWYLRLCAAIAPAAVTGLFTKLPAPLVKGSLGLAFAPTATEGRQVLYQQVQESDTEFMAWSIKALARWDNVVPPPKLFHIHGSADRLLPRRYVNADVIIQGGGHFIIFTHGQQIGQIIAEKVAAVRST